MPHYQVRLVKSIESDGTILTFPVLGKMYQSHDQKTLRGYHSLEEATSTAQNLNSSLPPEVKGMVIVRFKPGKAVIAIGDSVKPHVKAHIRKARTTEWVRFVERDGSVFSVSSETHKISRDSRV